MSGRGEGVAVRPYAPADQPRVEALVLSIQRGEFAVDITAAEQPDLVDIDRFVRRGAGEFWVAQEGDRIVGTAALLDPGAGFGVLRKMFVAADRRGAGFGIGRRLLDAALAHARAKGLAAVWLGTTAAYHAAHRFYEKNGFTRVEPESLPPAFPRIRQDSRFYRIALGPSGRGG